LLIVTLLSRLSVSLRWGSCQILVGVYAQLPSAAGHRRVHDLQNDYRKDTVLTALVWRLAIASLVVVVCHIWFLKEMESVVVLR